MTNCYDIKAYLNCLKSHIDHYGQFTKQLSKYNAHLHFEYIIAVATTKSIIVLFVSIVLLYCWHNDEVTIWILQHMSYEAIRRRSDYIRGFVTPAIGPNKSKKLTRLTALAHNIRGKVWMKKTACMASQTITCCLCSI